MDVTIIGADGFVGSAFRRLLESTSGVRVLPVTRYSYATVKGTRGDITIDASGSSRKFIGEEHPVDDFDLSVRHRLRTLLDFPAALQVHISSVDVYNDLTSAATTQEHIPIHRASESHYGFHKLLAEEVVTHYASRWLIVRLAGMVGPALRKNPVYDILNGQPLRIHPESRYQFMHTDDMASLAWLLVEGGHAGEIFNVCGRGLISPREVADLAGCSLDITLLSRDVQPRLVDVSTEKLARYTDVPVTREAIRAFIAAAAQRI